MPNTAREFTEYTCVVAAGVFAAWELWALYRLLFGSGLDAYQQALAIAGTPLCAFAAFTFAQRRFSLKMLMTCMAVTCVAWGVFLPITRHSQRSRLVYATLSRCGCSWDMWSQLTNRLPARVTMGHRLPAVEAMRTLESVNYSGLLVIPRDLSAEERELVGQLGSLRGLELRMGTADPFEKLAFKVHEPTRRLAHPVYSSKFDRPEQIVLASY